MLHFYSILNGLDEQLENLQNAQEVLAKRYQLGMFAKQPQAEKGATGFDSWSQELSTPINTGLR